MFEKVARQSGIAAKHGKVQRGCIPVAAAYCNRPAKLDHQPYTDIAAFSGHVR
jgi:hypothetical protein